MSGLDLECVWQRRPKMITEEEKLKTCALRLLSRREHSRAELRRKLLLRKFSSAMIDAILDKLTALDWQNDQRFAELFVRSEIMRGQGPLKIRYNLRERGLDPRVIEELLVQEPEIWQESLNRVWESKYLPALDRGEQIPQDRQMRFLYSRGFTPEQIRNFMQAKAKDKS